MTSHDQVIHPPLQMTQDSVVVQKMRFSPIGQCGNREPHWRTDKTSKQTKIIQPGLFDCFVSFHLIDIRPTSVMRQLVHIYSVFCFHLRGKCIFHSYPPHTLLSFKSRGINYKFMWRWMQSKSKNLNSMTSFTTAGCIAMASIIWRRWKVHLEVFSFQSTTVKWWRPIEKGNQKKSAQVYCLLTNCRIWFVHVTGSRKAALQSMAPTEIGYMNVIPKCVDASGKYPIYENLPDTYAAINAYLTESPLEGW